MHHQVSHAKRLHQLYYKWGEILQIMKLRIIMQSSYLLPGPRAACIGGRSRRRAGSRRA